MLRSLFQISLIVFAVFAIQQPIDVFIITHTHDDVGWLLTVDQYYIQQVQFILDSCIDNLLENPNRKFTYVEQGYFERWWNEISEQKRNQVRQLVKNGQLEFNVGGITMNDEATTTYYEEINQMTQGALFIEQQLGSAPHSIWHVDPFGHSAATASLWAQIGFSGFVLNRIPYELKNQMKADQGLEFVWRPSKSLGEESQIWIHVLDSHYSSPNECAFNNNDGWNGIYIQDDPRLFGVNVQQIADNFVSMVKSRSAWYRHNKLLIPFGDDFAHREAFNSFVNMDKLINYVNNNTDSYGVRVQYAFLSDYVNAVNSLNLTWPVFESDFFPYNDDDQSYWSGYYTSRPLLKKYVRTRDSLLNIGEQLFVLGRSLGLHFNTEDAFNNLEVLRQATSIATHHDAVSGTEKQAVADDYSLRLQFGSEAAEPVIEEIATVLLGTQNIKMREDSTETVSTVVVHNPLAWNRVEFVSILLNTSNVYVTFLNGTKVPSQANPVPPFSSDYGSFRLFFLATVPALSLTSYNIHITSYSYDQNVQVYKVPMGSSGYIKNNFYSVSTDPNTGRISEIADVQSGKTFNISQDLQQYVPENGIAGQPSGAYIFRPSTNSLYNIGSHTNGVSEETIIVNFPIPYSSAPFIMAFPVGQDYPDVFSFTTRNPSADGFEVNIYRLNSQESWGQNLQMDYIAWENSPNGIQMGTYSVGSSITQLASISVQFISPFDTPPVVFLTARGEDVEDAFVVSTTGVNLNGFTANIYRVDTNNSGWSQNLSLDWMAFTSVEDLNILAGTATIGSSNANEVSFTINHVPFSSDPVVMATARGSNLPDTFAVTSRSIDATTLVVNIIIVNGNSWSQNLQLDWMIMDRNPVIESVTDDPVTVTVVNGPYVQELQQFWRSNYGQTVRIYNSQDYFTDRHIEILHDIGPLDLGRELVTLFSTNLNNNRTWFTDDNGLEMQTRIFNFTRSELVAGNYYPMVSRAYIRDSDQDVQLTLMSDNSHGCGSNAEGALEVMLHRRCLSDDGRGVGEVLNETTHIQPALWIVLSSIEDSAELHRVLSIKQNFPLAVFPVNSSTLSPQFSAMPSLPFNVHLLNLRAVDVDSNMAILRLQHIFEVGEDPIWSQPATVDLDSLFYQVFQLKNVTEMNLTGNIPKSEVNRLQWNTNTNNFLDESWKQSEKRGNIVQLNPMEIKTFLVNLSS